MFLKLITIIIFLATCSEFETHDAGESRGVFSFLFGTRKTCHCKCGVPNRNGRLLGGEYIAGHEFPWLSVVHVRTGTNIQGTLINDRYILTAASPLQGITAYNIKVTLGAHDRCIADVASTNVSVDAVFLHPDFDPITTRHDIALLRLANVVPFERRIQPICLPDPVSQYLGQVATVVGWAQGPSPEGAPLSTCRPRKIGLPVLGEQCDAIISEVFGIRLAQHQGCIGVVGGISSICENDAGGAVQFRSHLGYYEIIGILTELNDCSSKPSTALFTRVNAHLTWITDHTKDACYCIKP